MARQMTVNLSELDAWADQVDRASRDLEGISANASSRLAQQDFGPIMEALMGSWSALLPRVNDTLSQDSARLGDHGAALRSTSMDYLLTEHAVTERSHSAFFDARSASRAFADVADTAIPAARPTQAALPQVSFGFPYDMVCDLIRALTGFDVRAELAERVGGDVVSASTQASSFTGLSRSVRAVSSNLSAGSSTISEGWDGEAAMAAISQISTWVGELDGQAARMAQMGISMVQVCRSAWEVATSVVQCIKAAVQTVSSALATLSIPGVGWARVVRAVWQAFQALMKAFKVIKQFISLLKTLAQYVDMIATWFDTGKLPTSTPGTPVAAASTAGEVGRVEAVRVPIFGGARGATA